MSKKLLKVAVLLGLWLFGSVLLHSCYYDNAEDYYANLPVSGCDTVAVSFTARVKPILDNSCATSGCHSGAVPAGGVDLTSTANAQAFADRIVFRTQQGTMPPTGRLNDCHVNTLAAWLHQGASNN